MLQDLAEEYKFQILAMEVMPDHIHLLVNCKPQFNRMTAQQLYGYEQVAQRIANICFSFRYDKNYERESCTPDVSGTSGIKERTVGRASVESVLLCHNGQ